MRPVRQAAPLARAESRLALLLIAPTLLLLIALGVYPLAYSIWESFKFDNIYNHAAAHFAGFGNYQELFHDVFFFKSLELTLLWTAIVVPLELGLGLAIALLLDRQLRGAGLLRALFVMPVFIAPIAMGLTWRFMFEPVSGVMNGILRALGLPPSLWLSGPQSALPSVMIADVWQWTPFVAILLLAGIQAISPSVREAARLDRVRGLAYVRLIVVPLIWPVIVVVVLLRLVDSIRIFDLFYIMTGGGPGSATLIAPLYDYSIFTSGDYGETAALGIFILILINVVVVVFLRILSRQVRRPRVVR